MKTLVIIPSRLSASRLPGKPLLKINGLSIISHVYKKAQEADIGDVVVAAEDREIVKDVRKNGGEAILTSNNHQTGTDRVHEALIKLGRTDVELVMNLQGDEPLMNIKDIQNLNSHMVKTKYDLGTLAAKINDRKFFKNNNIVKVITEESLDHSKFSKALNFMRKLDNESDKAYHHLGIYCYKVEILKRFISFKQSQNEIKNKLEQLRALDNNININVALAKSSPIGVDTKEDFMAIKKIMEYKS
jgi:3-deoxy-manno-octulosonate cytidylyltransferase (CMP-KDO synthetase)